MDIGSLVNVGWKHAQNALAEEIYLRTQQDFTKPTTFYGLVNERCNIKCRYCEYWRFEKYVDEMSIDEWKAALSSVKEFVGSFFINFSGGEPYIKVGFLDLLKWCNENGIRAGVTTNGSAMTERNAARTVAANPFNLNFSIDAPNAELHDYQRGYPGLFDKLTKGLGHVRAEQERQSIYFPIIAKPTITRLNFRLLPELVEWAVRIGFSVVNPQPVERWSPETYNELWIEEAELPELEQVCARLMEMKQQGAPILMPEQILRLLPDHFREKPAPREVMPCRVGLRNFFIHTNGDVKVCFHDFPAIGNIKRQSAREIWYSQEATKVRADTVACERLCLVTCLSQKTIAAKVKMGLTLLANRKRVA